MYFAAQIIQPIFYNIFKWSIIYKNFESLCCTPESNTILYINCISIKKHIKFTILIILKSPVQEHEVYLCVITDLLRMNFLSFFFKKVFPLTRIHIKFLRVESGSFLTDRAQLKSCSFMTFFLHFQIPLSLSLHLSKPSLSAPCLNFKPYSWKYWILLSPLPI